MKPKEAYLFRSATDSQDVTNKKGVMHSSFRITNENHIRKSAELRFLIFKKQKKEPENNSQHPLTGGYKNTKKTKNRIKKNQKN